MRTPIVIALILVLVGPASVWAQSTESCQQEPANVVLEKTSFTKTISQQGTFVPADVETVSLWLEEFAGELVLLDVLEHGTPVSKGDVIARFDLTRLDRQIVDAEHDLEAMHATLKNTHERAMIEEMRAQTTLEDARVALEETRRNLTGWEEHELELARRDAAMSLRYTENNIEDQKDELAQLEAMYREDELTDATEEIVLKRARRDLGRTITYQKNQIDRRRFQEAFKEVQHTRQMRRSVANQEASLDRLLRSQEIDRSERKQRIAASERGLKKQAARLERLRHDRERLIVRAPRRGVLIHGSPDNYRPGQVAPRYERGVRAAQRAVLFTCIDPEKMTVALTIPESKLSDVRPHMAARIEPVAASKASVLGTLHYERFPMPQSAATGENTFRAKIALESSIAGAVPGMRANVELVQEELEGVFVVPLTALCCDGGETYLWLSDATTGTYERVPIERGPSNAREVVVSGDLDAGQKVLLCAPEA